MRISYKQILKGRNNVSQSETENFFWVQCGWVIERVHSWLNRFRRLLVRWEKKPQNYLAFLHFARGLIAFRAAGLFG